MRLCGYFVFFPPSDTDSSSTLDLQVYAHRSFRRDDHMGKISERVDKLLEQGATGSRFLLHVWLFCSFV